MAPEYPSASAGGPRYGFEDMTFEQMESHPEYGPIFQDAALQFLKDKDPEYFTREFSGERDTNGYLFRKDGTSSNTRPSQNISGPGLKIVEAIAKQEIGRRLGKK